MRKITIITAALVCGTALCLIISTDHVSDMYKQLGIALPGITEDVFDFHHYHGDWLLLAVAGSWLAKDRYLTGMRHQKALAIAGLVAATLLPLLVVAALLLPLVKLTETVGVQA
jgi:hypothetical protein